MQALWGQFRRILQLFHRPGDRPTPTGQLPGRRLSIDTGSNLLRVSENGRDRELPLYSAESFELVSREWVRIGWSLRYYHTFTWFGRPVLQLPEDLIRVQEVVMLLKPDLIIETGIFDGGSLLFYASLCEMLGKGRVFGIDIEIREGTRRALSEHPLAGRIEMHEGSSILAETVAAVTARIKPGETVMIMLDSHHSREHVEAELEAYAPMVSQGSCIVAADGIMRDLSDVPGGQPEWATDNPASAAVAFAARHPEFELRPPQWQTNISQLGSNVTYWPDAWLWRK